MKQHANRSELRVPMVVLYLAGTVVGAPFFLLAFALTPLSGTWLMFAVAALPFTALVALWVWVRRPKSAESNVSVGAFPQEAYPPGA